MFTKCPYCGAETGSRFLCPACHRAQLMKFPFFFLSLIIAMLGGFGYLMYLVDGRLTTRVIAFEAGLLIAVISLTASTIKWIRYKRKVTQLLEKARDRRKERGDQE